MTKVVDDQAGFKGQEFFVGIDVHKRSWKVTIRSQGLELQTFSMGSPSPAEVAKHLRRRYPGGIYKSAYEAGFCGFWIHRELCQAGIESLVVHAADVPSTNKQRVTKTDKVDSRKLASRLEEGSLKALYVPDPEIEKLRALNRLRFRAVSHLTRLKNRIKGHLHYFGVTIEDEQAARYWSGAFIAELAELAKAEHPAARYLDLSLIHI